MLFRNEITFIEKMLASLRLLEVERIPFSNEEFESGVEALHQYLKNKLSEGDYEKIELLFIKSPIQGTHDRFIDGIKYLNGSLIKFLSVQNPYWEEAFINMDKRDANNILPEDCSEGSLYKKTMIEAARTFYEGAQGYGI